MYPKSRTTAFFLSVFFPALGWMYASIPTGLTLLIAFWIAAITTGLIGAVFVWLAGIFIVDSIIVRCNERVDALNQAWARHDCGCCRWRN